MSLSKQPDASDELLSLRYRSTKDESYLNLLLQRHHALMVHCASIYSVSSIPFDDRLSVAQMGFVNAVNDFDPLRGAKLTSYAVWRIRQALTDLNREMQPWMTQIIDAPTFELYEADKTEQEGETDGYDYSQQEASESIYTVEIASLLRNSFTGVKKREIEAFCHIHGILGYEQLTQKEIADQMGCSRQYVQQIVGSVYNLIRGRITQQYDRDEVL